MRVGYGIQIFSRSVAAGIKTALAYNKFSDPSKALSTMHFCDKMDMIFDALNSKKHFDSNPNRTALKIENQSYKILKSSLSFIANIKVCKEKTKVYCFSGLLQTIKAVLDLTDEFLHKNENISFILTSRFNQDPCENMFSIIRQRGGNSRNPTVHHFNDIIAQIMSMKLIQPTESSNCEDDNDEMLIDPNNYFQTAEGFQLHINNETNAESENQNSNFISYNLEDKIIESISILERMFGKVLRWLCGVPN